MGIEILPPEAITKLQSGIIITDAIQCILELVYNSLDAQATIIAIQVDMKNYKIQVADNGRGIPSADLDNIGKRFMTSKYHSFLNSNTTFTTYGYKGQAISSLLDVCKTLKIETKTHQDGPTFIKVFQDSKALPIIEEVKNCGVGTTVTVEDFMCTMPVRQKRIDEIFDLEEIKAQLKYLAIVHYKVSFTLRNENKCLILFETQCAPSILTSVKNIFGASVAKAFKIIDYQDKNYEIMGLVSKKPQVQNNLQLLYVNKRVITKGMIHKVINDLLSNYIKQRGVFSKSSEESIIFKSGKHTASNAFILEIRCPVTYYELFTNVRKSTVEFKCWKDVLKCIRKAIKKPFSFGENITTSSTKVMKNETKNNNASKNKRKLGTSLLINAIKGMEARRKLRSKFNSKPCKIDSESYDERKSSTLFDESFKENSNSISKKNVHSQSTHKFFGDCTLDSMESPIPKKRLKSNLIKNYKCESKPETGEVTIHNQSFFQFYKWLKEEIKIDPDAFRFYQTYMQHKQQANNKIRTDHFSETGRKGTPVMENEIFRNIEKIYNNLRITEKKKTLNKNQYTNLHLTAKYSENQGIVNACHRKNLIDFSHGSNDFQGIWNCLLQSQNFKKNFQQFSKFNCGPIINNYKESSFQIGGKQAQVALRNAELSPAPSENFFSNFIRLRNLSHTLERQFLSKKGQCFIDDNDSLDCGTWISHYQNPLNLNTAYNQTAFEKEEFVSWVDHKVTKNFENFRKNDSKRKNLDVNHRTQNFLCNTAEPFDFRRPLYDVGIQYSKIDTSNINFCSGKKSVMVQTDKFIDIDNNTSASILSSAMNSEKILTPHESVGDRDPRKINKDIFQKLDQKTIQHKKKHESQADLNKEVPCPDFWNTSLTESFDKETNAPLFISDDSRAKKPPTLKSKYSLPSQPLCREQIIELETKMQESSLSKDMIATLWPECLNEFESFSDNADCVVKSSLSGVKSDSTELPKTIPLEELELSLPVTTQQQFCLAERHNFIPKGLSPKFLHADPTDVPALSPDKKNQIKLVVDDAENESLAYVKWRDESTGGSIKSTIPGGILDEMRQKAERNLIYCENEIISASLSCNAIKVHNLLHSFAFTKELLSGVQIIGQLDKKFIVAKMTVLIPKKKELITLFDQHAVDERVKLEKLMNDYISADGEFSSTSLNPAINCKLSESMMQIATNLKDKFLRLGLSFKSVDKQTVTVETLPTFLVDKSAKEKKNKKEACLVGLIQTLFAGVVDELTKTRGALLRIPKILYNMFCSEACHSAVKFNKVLAQSDMTEMIQKLSSCKLPFQCAHGRPSVIPIIDLEDFKDVAEGEQISLKNLSTFLDNKHHND